MMKKGILVFVAFALVVVWNLPAMGATDQERLKALEDKVQTIEDQVQLKEKKGTPAVSFWKNDFFLSTPDEKFWMKIRGNIHFDTKFYDGTGNNPTRFDIRRARMDFQGMWYEYMTFRVQAEFADSPYIRNAWADFKFTDWLHLRGGQMKPPFSTSWWTLDNRVNFLERGASTPLYPYFDRGWWIWGYLFDETLTYNLSAWTGAGMELDDNKGDIDDHKDYVARLFYSPFKNQETSVLKGLHLCVQGSRGEQSVPTKRFELGGYGAAIRDDKFWTWQTETDTTRGEISGRDRWGAELHYIGGPFSLSSEYLVTHYDDIDVYNKRTNARIIREDGNIRSWSTWVSWFLTGEKKGVSNFGWQQPNPKKDFDPVHLEGTGAWEVLARYTRTQTSRGLFDSGILSGSWDVDEYTLGLCWTWNPMVRWQLNYVHLDGDHGRGIQTGSGSSDGTKWVDDEDMVGLRMIFKF